MHKALAMGAALFGLVLLPPMAAIAAELPPVSTASGQLQGALSQDGSTASWKGIPYAAPPVGALRWREPQPVSAWQGVRPATQFGAGCMQKEVTGPRLPWTLEYLHTGSMSEDCLTLNAWAPAGGSKLPVIVFFHGGGFTEGSGSIPVYDGENISHQGVVFVTVNYRLGVFGLLAHPALSAESGSSGNYALYDQIAALRWIKENVAALGGDPGNVTIMGQSAGAQAVMVLNASPLAKGLYQRAIMDSAPGTTITNYPARPTEMVGLPRAEAEKIGADWAHDAGFNDLAALRSASAADINRLSVDKQPIRGPVIDGRLLPDRVSAIYLRHAQNDVPILAGTNRDERGSEKDYGSWGVDQLRQYGARSYPLQTDVFNALYGASSDDEAHEVQRTLMRDERRFGLAWLANMRASTGDSPNYLYFFNRPTPWPQYPQYGAFHSSELPYVFGNQARLDRPWTSLDTELSKAMSAYWVNFARTGNPNGDGLPAWDAFNGTNQRLLELGPETRMVEVIAPNKAVLLAEKQF
ncbi:carboxylesterase/lipase family protein [Roseomonas elaeocarpi]|uniref:Carboxylesterase/lipase family protein n=1 Tax=Roseomonas elaeocarpi TaxID=907779 RepID=A0ABV6JT90_9PROT